MKQITCKRLATKHSQKRVEGWDGRYHILLIKFAKNNESESNPSDLRFHIPSSRSAG